MNLFEKKQPNRSLADVAETLGKSVIKKGEQGKIAVSGIVPNQVDDVVKGGLITGDKKAVNPPKKP